MGIKEVIQDWGKRKKEAKEKFKDAEEDWRINKQIEERQKSANERELERYIKEDRETAIKKRLDFARIKREEDISLNHNPLNTKFIMKSDKQILKNRNVFADNKNVFSNKGKNVILNNNKKLLNGRNIFTR
jgi:hypothetical protein